ICDVFLGHWQAAKGLTGTLTVPQKRTILQLLAAHMMKEEKREIAALDAVRAIRERLAAMGVSGTKGGLAFLEDVQHVSGLLIETEPSVYTFAHHTFQEYLAASHFVNPKTNGEELLIQHISDPWWRETIKLYCAQTDATNVVQACLAQAYVS